MTLTVARILIVEDDLAINDLITMNLRVAGCECDAVFDGAEAIAAIEKQVYDLALLDVIVRFGSQQGVFRALCRRSW